MKRAPKTLTPYSLVKETGSNVPALKHFFPMTERSGTIITDIKGGCVWDVSVGGHTLLFNQHNTLNTVEPYGMLSSGAVVDAYPVQLASGNFHTFNADKPIIVLFAGRKTQPVDGDADQPRFSIGDNNGVLSYDTPAGIATSNSTLFHCLLGTQDNGNKWRVATSGTPAGDAVIDTNTSQPLVILGDNFDLVDPADSSSAAGDGQDVMQLIVWEPAGTKSATAYDITTRTRWMYGWTTTNDTLAAPFTPNPCMKAHGWACYGYAIFEFTALPSDYLLACTWMAQEWKRGNRVIWPGWIGK